MMGRLTENDELCPNEEGEGTFLWRNAREKSDLRYGEQKELREAA
jgi:hypothetical protein